MRAQSPPSGRGLMRQSDNAQASCSLFLALLPVLLTPAQPGRRVCPLVAVTVGGWISLGGAAPSLGHCTLGPGRAWVSPSPSNREPVSSQPAGRDVHLHPHQPDPPHQCGGGPDEARGEALRDRLLQEQGRGLAERRVSRASACSPPRQPGLARPGPDLSCSLGRAEHWPREVWALDASQAAVLFPQLGTPAACIVFVCSFFLVLGGVLVVEGRGWMVASDPSQKSSPFLMLL